MHQSPGCDAKHLGGDRRMACRLAGTSLGHEQHARLASTSSSPWTGPLWWRWGVWVWLPGSPKPIHTSPHASSRGKDLHLWRREAGISRARGPAALIGLRSAHRALAKPFPHDQDPHSTKCELPAPDHPPRKDDAREVRGFSAAPKLFISQRLML